jgi:hypothetical protein
MNQTEKIFIILGFLVILIYFFYYFDLDNIIINFMKISCKEPFTDNFFRPNKIFKHQGKIYLFDTREILENGINPLVFNSFKDYQKYIISLEEEFKKGLHLVIDKKKKPIENIKEKEIPGPNLKIQNKKEHIDRYNKHRDCLDKELKCSLEVENDFVSIFDPLQMKKFKEKNCSKKTLTKKQCTDIEEILKRNKELNKICYNKKMNEREYHDKFKDICKKYRYYSNDFRYLKKDCFEENSIYEKCMMEDYLRENMQPFTD